METRCENLVYEHKHGRFGWHPKTRMHKGSDYLNACIVCHIFTEDMEYDEFLDGYVCKKCDMKREIGVLK